ncbi:MAG TPA: COX15/CtaA family protein [Gaiellaceae bacterium]|nr:COX15/CtaA family protein [Gaiellaceae bacterium]
MQTGAHTLGRVREVVLSAESFRRIAIANAAMLVVIMATGATVRLTGSGLGCHHWPGCAPNQPFPEQGFHSYVEFGNRVVAFITICVTLATWIAARFARMSTRVRRLAMITFVGTLLQAPLGAITVYYHLNPWLVLTHFLLSIAVLTLGVVLALEVTERALPDVPMWVRSAGLVVAFAAIVLIISGTFATAAGPHPGSTVVRRLWSFQPAVYWHVRATAVFGISFALLLVWLVRAHSRHVRAALIVLALLAVQMTVGEIQYRTLLPWWLVLIHVTTAATVWAAIAAFVYRLWRPPMTRVAK